MKRFSLFFCTVLILSLLFSVCLPVGCHAETGEEEMMTVLARQLQEKLDPVFLTVADKIDAEMNGYEASGEILEYVLVGEHGPDHAKTFEMEARLNSNVIGRGTGRSKREAEQAAAAQALVLFGKSVPEAAGNKS